MTPLGLVAGGGDLPLRVAAAVSASGRPMRVVVLEGFADPGEWRAYPHLVIRLGAAGTAIEWMRGQGVVDLVMAGQVRRPSFLSLRPDAATAGIVARIGMRAFAGDDGLLSALRDVLRSRGFRLLGPDQVLVGLQTPVGLLTRRVPDAVAMNDIARGVAVVRALGTVDVGQGAVVQAGIVLGVEAVEGTNAMLARCGALRREGPGGVLVKLVKPGQDRSLDMPSLGPATIPAAVAAGLRGIAFEAEGALIVDRDSFVREADSAGLFLLAIRPDDHMGGSTQTGERA